MTDSKLEKWQLTCSFLLHDGPNVPWTYVYGMRKAPLLCEFVYRSGFASAYEYCVSSSSNVSNLWTTSSNTVPNSFGISNKVLLGRCDWINSDNLLACMNRSRVTKVIAHTVTRCNMIFSQLTCGMQWCEIFGTPASVHIFIWPREWIDCYLIEAARHWLRMLIQ